MDQFFSIAQLTFSIVTSFIAGVLVLWYVKIRRKQITAKIDEIEWDKEHLEKISKGNIELIRFGFRVLSFGFGLIAFSISALIFTSLLGNDSFIKQYIIIFAGIFCATAGFISIMFFNQLLSIKDMKTAKERLSKKQEKLREKLK